jgi:hypothetical protein
MINSDTDLKIFIDENKTYSTFVHKVEFKNYEQSSDMQQQKTGLINKINQQKY